MHQTFSEEGRKKSKQSLNKGGWGRGCESKFHTLYSPLKPVKFPQSSRELLKEGRETLKNGSVPLDGFRMLSVNRFICSRVLIR